MKSVMGHIVHVMSNLCFYICGSHSACYVELVFLHPVGSVGHGVQSSTSGVRNIKELLLMLGPV
jgi:hypothetical protein